MDVFRGIFLLNYFEHDSFGPTFEGPQPFQVILTHSWTPAILSDPWEY